MEENVVQPLLVCESAITLAAETVAMILKIDGTFGGFNIPYRAQDSLSMCNGVKFVHCIYSVVGH